jgi:hypothetical protein
MAFGMPFARFHECRQPLDLASAANASCSLVPVAASRTSNAFRLAARASNIFRLTARTVMSMGPLSFLFRPTVLNRRRDAAATGLPATAPVARPAAADLAADLRARIQDLYVAHVTLDGVDYRALTASQAFAAYKDTVATLADFDAVNSLPSDEARVAFFVNLYNALTIHAFAELGPPADNSVARLLFNAQACYNVGGHTLSLSDIENGVLRRNRGVSMWPRPFGRSDDRRLALMVARVDPRIHFVLNCGAQSCPPIRFLTADKLEDQLALATRAFLRQPSNFSIRTGGDRGARTDNPGGGMDMAEDDDNSDSDASSSQTVVTLSAILRWYKTDFASDGSNQKLLRFVADSADARDESTVLLRHLLDEDPSATTIRLKFAPYDWSLNAYKASTARER